MLRNYLFQAATEIYTKTVSTLAEVTKTDIVLPRNEYIEVIHKPHGFYFTKKRVWSYP